MSSSIKSLDQSVWHPFDSMEIDGQIPVVEARGVYLKTESGEELVDAISSWWVNLHGHGRPEIAQALSEQFLKTDHVIFAGFTHTPAATLASRLLKILPGNFSKIFYTDNGSTATEAAVKIALQYFHNQGIIRNKIIAWEGAYHGDTFGAMSVGGRTVFNRPFNHLLFDVLHLPFPTGYNDEEILQLLEQYLNRTDLCAFIYEPLVQGAAGMRMYSAELLEKVLSKLKKAGVLLIADEVMTGFGRTGRLFASEYCHTKPDMICMSKGITGGVLPLGATAVTADIYAGFDGSDVYKIFLHGHSYTGNPLACAAANASLDILLSEKCQEDIRRISGKHAVAQQRSKDNPLFKNVRNLGTVLAYELNTSEISSYTSGPKNILYKEFIRQGLLLRPLGNVVYVLPPYVMDDATLAGIYDTIETTVSRVLKS